MKVIALDIATSTGFAYWDTSKSLASIETRTIKVPKRRGRRTEPGEYQAFMLPGICREIFGQFDKPDFCIVEMRPMQLFGQSRIEQVTLTNCLHGAYYAILGAWGVPYQTVAPATWRAKMYGDAKKGMSRGELKNLAKFLAKDAGIECNNDDEAEAAQLVQWGAWHSDFAINEKLKEQQNG